MSDENRPNTPEPDGPRPPRGATEQRPPGSVQGGPFVTRCTAGKFAWCRCRQSATYPFCDGSHRTTDGGVTPLKVVLDRARTVAWCACGRSRNAPFCDGSHASP